jgi:hypothetical protein
MTWADDNHRKWKARQIGLRLVHSASMSTNSGRGKTLNDVLPSEWDKLRGMSSKERAQHFVAKHWPDDAA